MLIEAMLERVTYSAAHNFFLRHCLKTDLRFFFQVVSPHLFMGNNAVFVSVFESPVTLIPSFL